MATPQEIEAALRAVEHPEIALPLVDLGMVRDIQVDESGARLTLVIPFMGIPDVVRDLMIGSLRQAVEAQGSTLTDVEVAVMTEEERQAFFQKEHANWRG